MQVISLRENGVKASLWSKMVASIPGQWIGSRKQWQMCPQTLAVEGTVVVNMEELPHTTMMSGERQRSMQRLNHGCKVSSTTVGC